MAERCSMRLLCGDVQKTFDNLLSIPTAKLLHAKLVYGRMGYEWSSPVKEGFVWSRRVKFAGVNLTRPPRQSNWLRGERWVDFIGPEVIG